MIICCIIQACFAVFFFYRLQTTGSAARVGYEDIATGARRDGPEDLGNSVLGISDINNVVVTAPVRAYQPSPALDESTRLL